MNKYNLKVFFKTFFITIICFILVTILILGIGVVDNTINLAQDIEFTNRLYFNPNNYILCFRYLGVATDLDLSFIQDIVNLNIVPKPLIATVIITFGYVKSQIESLIELVF